MIKYVNTTMLPTFLEDEQTWKQIVPFSDGHAYAEIHLFYNVEEKDWEFSTIFYKTGDFYEPIPSKDQKTILELYQNEEFRSFLETRKNMYDEIESLKQQSFFSMEQIEIEKESDANKTYRFSIEGSSLHWRIVFLKTLFGWQCFSLEIIQNGHVFGNVKDLLPFQSSITSLFATSFIETSV